MSIYIEQNLKINFLYNYWSFPDRSNSNITYLFSKKVFLPILAIKKENIRLIIHPKNF